MLISCIKVETKRSKPKKTVAELSEKEDEV
jgi:hypothetical protein